MNTQVFESFLEKKTIMVSDGATGTNLIARGLPRGKTGEDWVLEEPEKIINLHRDFIRSGANIILTCTFGASRVRLKQSECTERFEEINTKAVELAKKAADAQNTLVAGSLGPLGEMIQPFGTMHPDDAKEYYAEQAKILVGAGVDLLVIETQFDLNEAKAAINGVRFVSDIALICSFSFDRGTKTMMGISPAKFAAEVSHFDLAALGINCGKSLADNLACLKELNESTDLPIWFKPNAGLPQIDSNGNPAYSVTPAQMGSHVPEWIENGARIIGGCCGTSPDHLKQIASAI